MRVRILTTSALVVLVSLVLALPALAEPNNGEGLVGETDDKIITFFSLGVVLFFFLVVCLGSFIQGRLEKRKEARKAADLRQRIGW
jgi:hypothetical protein